MFFFPARTQQKQPLLQSISHNRFPFLEVTVESITSYVFICIFILLNNIQIFIYVFALASVLIFHWLSYFRECSFALQYSPVDYVIGYTVFLSSLFTKPWSWIFLVLCLHLIFCIVLFWYFKCFVFWVVSLDSNNWAMVFKLLKHLPVSLTHFLWVIRKSGYKRTE